MGHETWTLNLANIAMLGYVPTWLEGRGEDESIVDCIDRNYTHGGGWRDFDGFNVDTFSGVMEYPGDPAMKPIAQYGTADERMWMYHHSWVTVLDKRSGTTRTARID